MFSSVDTTQWSVKKSNYLLISGFLDDAYLEAATDAMRAIIEKMCKENSPSLNEIGEKQLEVNSCCS